MSDAIDEQDVSDFVLRFYQLVLKDALLGPMFRAAVVDLEEHRAAVEDFWSAILLGTRRYQDDAFRHHAHLVFRKAHFDRWIAALTQASGEMLPGWAAQKVLGRAAAMAGRLDIKD